MLFAVVRHLVTSYFVRVKRDGNRDADGFALRVSSVNSSFFPSITILRPFLSSPLRPRIVTEPGSLRRGDKL